MTDATTKPAKRRWWKYLLVLSVSFAVAALGLFIYVHTESFQALVRRRLVAELERLSGGRAEIGSIHTTPFRLQLAVRDITIHGRESGNDVPLAHADRITARLKISSLLRSELAFHEVILDGPVVHIVFYPDGTTNVLGRTLASANAGAAVEHLFALSIDHLELRRGQLLWDEQKFPLDFAARDISLLMDYSFLHRRYDGRLLIGHADTKLPDCRPFSWMLATNFDLSANSAVVPSFKWNSGHSRFSASGQIVDIRHPHFQGQYDTLIDLTEAGSIARMRSLRSGVLALRGHGDWSLDQFSTNGEMDLRDLAWQDAQLSFSRASVTSDYTVTDQQLKLSKLEGKLLGGGFTGEVEWNQWMAPPQRLSAAARKSLETATISAAPAKRSAAAAHRQKPPAIQNAFVTLRLRDLSAESIAAALNTASRPLLKLRPASSASGTIETRWKGTPADAEVHFDLDLTPPSRPAPAHMRLEGHAQGTYYAASDSLDLPQFTLSTPSSHVQASGILSATSSLRLLVSTSSVADWLPVLELVRGPQLIPVTLNGSATFKGGMSGSLSAPLLTGSLEVKDFAVDIPATAHTQALQTHWNSLAAQLQASFHAIGIHNARLQRDDTFTQFDATATLQHGHFTAESVFNLRANVHNADVAALQALAGYNYPIAGHADLSLQAAGTLGEPHAQGQIHLTNGSAYGESIRQFDSDFRLENGEISFNSLRLSHEGALVTGTAAYNPTTRKFQLDVTGNDFDLAELKHRLLDRVAIAGRANFVLKASGTPDAPSIDGTFHARHVVLDEELSGDFDLQATTEGNELQLAGTSNFQRGSLKLAGKVGLREAYPIELTLQMNQLDLDALWQSYGRGKLTGHSAVAGTLELRGPLRDPSQWTIAGNLNSLAVEIEGVKLHQQEPIRFSMANHAVNIQQVHMAGEGTDFATHGSMQLTGDRALDFAADGSLDMKLLSTLDPNFTSSGSVTMNMTIGGTLSQPLPQGRFQVSNGAIYYAGLPSGLTELNGSLLFSRDRLRIDTLSARTGGGMIDLKGDASYFNRQLTFDLTGTAKDVRLRYPPGVSSTADAQIHWAGTRATSTVSGDIRINRMAITPGFDFSAYLERSRQLVTVTAPNSPLYNVKLDIHVTTAPELQMRTAIARLSGDADLRIRGSIARPAVLGRVDILEGKATFHGTHFTLERGDITFANPVTIEPQLNLQASTRVRNYDLNVTLTGTPDRGLNLNYRSEPPLPKSDIIALLALGRTSGETEQLQEQSSESTYADQASAQILNEALSSTVSSRWQRLFGASNIKIDPQGLITETNPISTGPQITIEQEFANHVSLTYSTNVSQNSQQIIQGEYYFNRNISAVGTRDQNGVISFDLQMRRRKK